MFKLISGMVLGLVVATGCAAGERQAPGTTGATQQSAEAASVSRYENLSVGEAKRLVDGTPGLVVLDVREPYEFAEGRIPGARNMPLGQIAEWAPTLEPSKRYLVVCRSGSRSARASEELATRGFKGINNMTGGMLDWQQSAYPVER